MVQLTLQTLVLLEMIQVYQEVLLKHKPLMAEVLGRENLEDLAHLMLVAMEVLVVVVEFLQLEGLPQLDKDMMAGLVLPVLITA